MKDQVSEYWGQYPIKKVGGRLSGISSANGISIYTE